MYSSMYGQNLTNVTITKTFYSHKTVFYVQYVQLHVALHAEINIFNILYNI